MPEDGKIDLESLATKEIPPIASVSGWKDVVIAPSTEPLMPIGILSEFKIFSSSIYFSEHNNSPYLRDELSGALVSIFLRKEVAQSLVRAEQMLPNGYHLLVLDGWRPLEVQKSLYDEYYKSLQLKFPNWNEEELERETQKYVSMPSGDKTKPSPHNTGGAVDLAIIQLPSEAEEQLQKLSTKNTADAVKYSKIILSSAKLLEFGTPFDWGGPESALRYFEELAKQKELNEKEREALVNRRILYHLISSVGLEAYADEWWHYNARQTQMGAKTHGLKLATYSAVEISRADFEFELSRRELAEKIGGETVLPKAMRIKP